jgi:hypothetical protein
MYESQKRYLIVFFIVYLFTLTNVQAVKGEQPVISSRISEITEIVVNSKPSIERPQSTEFIIKVKTEILNRDDENHSITVAADCYPKVWIKAEFDNDSLELEQIIWCSDLSKIYIYPPGITEEVEGLNFYINQTGLSHLPDGNYTLHRTIPEGVQYKTEIIANSGLIKIIYHSFYYNRTEETTSENNHNIDKTNISHIIPIICFSILQGAIIAYRRKTTRK